MPVRAISIYREIQYSGGRNTIFENFNVSEFYKHVYAIFGCKMHHGHMETTSRDRK